VESGYPGGAGHSIVVDSVRGSVGGGVDDEMADGCPVVGGNDFPAPGREMPALPSLGKAVGAISVGSVTAPPL
jgi:hypothetical protein